MTETTTARRSLSTVIVQVLRTCPNPKCGAYVEKGRRCGKCRTTLKPITVKELVDRALAIWESPKGRTPRATASSRILDLERRGVLEKPERGVVIAAK